MSLPELKPCPFCGGAGEIADHHYRGTGASGMETPEPFARCKGGCVTMPKVNCTGWPYGKGKLPTYKQARQQAIAAWNTRTPHLVEWAGVVEADDIAWLKERRDTYVYHDMGRLVAMIDRIINALGGDDADGSAAK